ncbi:MAG TPA: biopolymer transporter ExbD [Bacteroidia bacterium]|nr:biopolymer transporter ExbD [Bacteroidia bacterium]
MSEVQSAPDEGGKKGKHSKLRAKKSSTHIDMTPMVDLAFLLLTFFMLTTTFSKPKTMEINMPVKPPPDFKAPEITNALTVLLTDKDKIYWYYNAFKPDTTTLQLTDFSPNGIHKMLLDYNKDVYEKVREQQTRLEKREIADTTYKRLRIEIMGDKKALTVLIKNDDKAKYRNIVDMLDELNIASVGKYAIVDISQPEFDLLKKTKGE